MRCRKARSLLSIYSNNELSGRSQVLLREHLSGCADCRKEHEIFTALAGAGKQLSGKKVSEDFNNNLLNRIAKERFNETRTKAYMPKRAPLVAWGKVVPVTASALVVAVIAIGMFGDIGFIQSDMARQGGQNITYLTAQPISNPNITNPMQREWSLDRQMAKAERHRYITNTLVNSGGFSRNSLAGSRRMIPYHSNYYRIRPVIKIYTPTVSNTEREGSGIY